MQKYTKADIKPKVMTEIRQSVSSSKRKNPTQGSRRPMAGILTQ